MRIRNLIKRTLVVLVALAMSATLVYADQPYAGKAKHKRSLRDAAITRAEDTYEDRNGETHDTVKDKVSISFTTDMEQSFDTYMKAATYQDEESKHYPRSFMLDGGNYSEVSPLNMVFGQYAPGLRIMGKAGYDIAGFGPSEIRQGGDKIIAMLNKAVNTGETLPYLTFANVRGTNAFNGALRNYGVNDYLDMNKYRTELAVFSVIGKEAFDSVAPSKLSYLNAVDTAKKIVAEIKEDEDADIIACFVASGVGTEDKEKKLEKEIARKVEGIDLIISVGSATELAKPIKEGNTRIFSLAAGSGKVGRIEYDIRDNEYHYGRYKTIELGKGYKDNGAVKKLLNDIKGKANKNFFAANGFTAGQVLAESFFDIAPIDDNTGKSGDSPLGELIADSYRYSAAEEGKLPKGNLIGLASQYSATGGIKKGSVTAEQIYDMMSEGRSVDGTKGAALTSFYLKGSDVKKLAEIAALSYEDPEVTRLYMSGLNYKYNPHRFKDSRVYDITVTGDDPALGIKLSDDTIYRFVTDSRTAEAVREMQPKDEALSVEIVDENGGELLELLELKMTSKENSSIKSWVAAASYISTFKETGIPASYKEPDGRMVYDDSKDLSHVYKGEFLTLLTMLGIALVGIAASVVLVLLVMNLMGIKHIKKTKKK